MTGHPCDAFCGFPSVCSQPMCHKTQWCLLKRFSYLCKCNEWCLTRALVCRLEYSHKRSTLPRWMTPVSDVSKVKGGEMKHPDREQRTWMNARRDIQKKKTRTNRLLNEMLLKEPDKMDLMKTCLFVVTVFLCDCAWIYNKWLQIVHTRHISWVLSTILSRLISQFWTHGWFFGSPFFPLL